ncbi:MAG: CDP-alcohol phosphatidyltransferase family protein [Chlamydiae bacterium]|nr:CDP-alcohol phosphatidyltransferase family protein [Chlamydiota bacterium]
MLNPPNSLSLLRAPLALLFLSENLLVRTLALIGAMLTDCIDGYLARRYKYTSKLGVILDPMMDKFFVFFTLAIFILEKNLLPWQALLMISRDLFLCIFALYLGIRGNWKAYKFRAVRWGKITTAMQFGVILLHTLHIAFPIWIYWSFLMVGLLMFVELVKLANPLSS